MKAGFLNSARLSWQQSVSLCPEKSRIKLLSQVKSFCRNSLLSEFAVLHVRHPRVVAWYPCGIQVPFYCCCILHCYIFLPGNFICHFQLQWPHFPLKHRIRLKSVVVLPGSYVSPSNEACVCVCARVSVMCVPVCACFWRPRVRAAGKVMSP